MSPRIRQEVRDAIESLVREMMERLMLKVVETDPFDPDALRRERPFHLALVPEIIFKASHLERRFVTPFGRVWEKLARTLGESRYGFAATDHRISGLVPQERLARIQEILNDLEHSSSEARATPDWDGELRHILAGDGPLVETEVICDVFIASSPEDRGGFAFELKAALPNSDQTKVSKEKLFKLHAMTPTIVAEAYYGLPYNPYGERANYNWSFPMRWFDMRSDPCVLIGEELWDKIGGPGTFAQFVEILTEVGAEYHQRIYDEFLRIPWLPDRDATGAAPSSTRTP